MFTSSRDPRVTIGRLTAGHEAVGVHPHDQAGIGALRSKSVFLYERRLGHGIQIKELGTRAADFPQRCPHNVFIQLGNS